MGSPRNNCPFMNSKIIVKPPKPHSKANSKLKAVLIMNHINKGNCYSKEYPLSKAIIPKYSSQKCLLYNKNNIKIAKNEDKKVKPKLNEMISHQKSNSCCNFQSLRQCDMTFKAIPMNNSNSQNPSSLMKKKVNIIPVQFGNIDKFKWDLDQSNVNKENELVKTAAFNQLDFNSNKSEENKDKNGGIKKYHSGSSIFNMNSDKNKNSSNQLTFSKSMNTPKIMKRHPLLKNMFY